MTAGDVGRPRPGRGPAGAPGPGSSADLAAWLAQWWRPFVTGTANLTQPILPGWTIAPAFTVNAGNSSAPATEAEILQRHSYGRQLGRMADALEALIAERPGDAGPDERFDDFLSMKREIDELKLDAAGTRVERLLTDLADLRHARPDEYERLRAALRRALDDA